MSDNSFVRTEILPERNPPSQQVGIISWLRANLFSTVPNTVLSILVIWAIYAVLSHILPWVFHASWSANSLSECRASIIAHYGEGATGACWAVIRDRALQMTYGFYPSEYHWRPNLAFILMLVALAPVLFDRLPRKMTWFTALYPFVAFWLLWGGSLWMPVMILTGFVLAYVVYVALEKTTTSLVAIVLASLTPILWWLFLSAPVADTLQSFIPLSIKAIPSSQFGGFLLSILIGITGIALSLPIGICLALGRQSDLLIVKVICISFIEFIRGVPLITLLFVASTLLNYFLPPGTSFDIIFRVIIMVTLFASAYMAEVIRGGLAALPTGQAEGAASLGLNFWQTTRLVTMPQALKISIPSIVSTFIALFKDTTLVSIIGLLDPIGLSTNIRADQAWNGILWELYGSIAVVFWVICFSMSRYSMYLERKLQTGH